MLGAIRRRMGTPCRQGSACGGDSAVDVVGTGQRNFGQQLLGGAMLKGVVIGRGGGLELSVDEPRKSEHGGHDRRLDGAGIRKSDVTARGREQSTPGGWGRWWMGAPGRGQVSLPPARILPQPMTLSLHGIHKTYGAVRALADVDLRLEAGSVHGLVGENGAGKSTLIGILAGLIRPDRGELRLAGQRTSAHSPRRARAEGIAVLHQTPRLFAELSVAENLLFGSGAFWRSKRGIHRQALAQLEHVGLELNPGQPARELSPAQQQLLCLARALAKHPRTLIMDEPTAVLPAFEASELMRRVELLRQEGVSVLYVSHRLDEVLRVADQMTVLRDGRRVWNGAARGVDPEDLIHHMVGREISNKGRRPLGPRAEVVLSVRGVSAPAVALEDIRFELRAGEILGVAGLVGAGRSELLDLLYGCAAIGRGELILAGAAYRPRSERDALQQGVVHLPEDRRRRGVVPAMNVAQNLSLAQLERVTRRGCIDKFAEHALARELVESFDVRAASTSVPVRTLSGGNQQKLALARGLARRPRVLLLDEPTQGIDVAGRAQIHDMIEREARRGAAILLASSDIDEVLALAHRVGVMRTGRWVATLTAAEADAERVLALALGVEAGNVSA